MGVDCALKGDCAVFSIRKPSFALPSPSSLGSEEGGERSHCHRQRHCHANICGNYFGFQVVLWRGYRYGHHKPSNCSAAKKKNVFTIEDVTRENPLNLGRFGISPEASSLAHRL